MYIHIYYIIYIYIKIITLKLVNVVDVQLIKDSYCTRWVGIKEFKSLRIAAIQTIDFSSFYL